VCVIRARARNSGAPSPAVLTSGRAATGFEASPVVALSSMPTPLRDIDIVALSCMPTPLRDIRQEPEPEPEPEPQTKCERDVGSCGCSRGGEREKGRKGQSERGMECV